MCGTKKMTSDMTTCILHSLWSELVVLVNAVHLLFFFSFYPQIIKNVISIKTIQSLKLPLLEHLSEATWCAVPGMSSLKLVRHLFLPTGISVTASVCIPQGSDI